MNEPEEQDWLERALRAPDPPIPDAGFTRRTLAALPPPRRQVRRRRRVLLLAAAVASALALLAAGPALTDSFGQLLDWRAWASCSIPWLALACIATVIGLTVSLATDDA
ncbi:MAG: hypothetical protein JXB32_09215 [Deltaproteobacteria bacterium]|nr:hypothetical protein [Deltaproteobacteria bacterium]